MRTLAKRFRVLSRKRVCADSGAEVMEMALVVPLVLTLVIGLIFTARAYDVYQTMTRAAREGARLAVLTSCATCGNTSYTDTYVRDNFVFPALRAANLDPANIPPSSYDQTYEWMDPGNASATPPVPPQQCAIKISFDYPFRLVVPFTSANLTTITLSTTVKMRLENQPTGSTCP